MSTDGTLTVSNSTLDLNSNSLSPSAQPTSVILTSYSPAAAPSNSISPPPSPPNSVSPAPSPSNSISPAPSPPNSISPAPAPSNSISPPPSPPNSISPAPAPSNSNSPPPSPPPSPPNSSSPAPSPPDSISPAPAPSNSTSPAPSPPSSISPAPSPSKSISPAPSRPKRISPAPSPSNSISPAPSTQPTSNVSPSNSPAPSPANSISSAPSPSNSTSPAAAPPNSISPAPSRPKRISPAPSPSNSISPAPSTQPTSNVSPSNSPAPSPANSISSAPSPLNSTSPASDVSPSISPASSLSPSNSPATSPSNSTSPAPSAQPISGGSSSGVGIPVIAGIVGGIIGALVLVAIIWVFLAKKKPKRRVGSRFGFLSSYKSMEKGLQSHEIQIAGPGVELNDKSFSQHPDVTKAFTYNELERATNGFSASNLLGEGGFGRVYKGTIDGNLVAVKQLKLGSGQGDREFRAEVEIISRVHHRHLVSLVGYCISQYDRLLVYKYVPNGTMEYGLHTPGQCMDWATRMHIALGTARGLAYLHEDCHPRIIHRDIKASNILLDDQWEAQVSDFGLAKLADDAQSHVTTRVMGTFGYVAPEYAMSGKLTDKSDVYSFGVVLLELITGKKPVDKTLSEANGEESLVEWARPLLTQALETRNVDAVVDPNLNERYNKQEMFRMVEVAATCVRHSYQLRPKMVEALRGLAIQDGDLHQGVLPGYSNEIGGEDIRLFRRMAFGSSISTSSTRSSSDYKGASRSDASFPSASSN